MTEYSDRSKELAEQLRQKALRNLGRDRAREVIAAQLRGQDLVVDLLEERRRDAARDGR